MNFPGDFPWTEENVERLKALAEEGLSFTQIAKQLGCPSKGAVSGKLDRLGMKKKKKTTRGGRPVSAKTKAKPSKLLAIIAPFTKAATTPKLSPDEPPFARDAILDKWKWPAVKGKHLVSFWDYEPGRCKWPNDGSVLSGTFRFCGAPVLSGCPYCRTHERMSRAGWRAAA